MMKEGWKRDYEYRHQAIAQWVNMVNFKTFKYTMLNAMKSEKYSKYSILFYINDI